MWVSSFDTLIIGAAFLTSIAESLAHEEDNVIHSLDFLLVLRVLRLIKVIGSIDTFKVIINTIIHVGPSILTYGGVLFVTAPNMEYILYLWSPYRVLYYQYAILGMELFNQKIHSSSPDEYCGNTRLNGSDFATSHYCTFNFNNLPSSFVVLFALMVVNQWHDILFVHNSHCSTCFCFSLSLVHMDCTTLEQRAVICFLNAEGIQTSQICQRMKNIYATPSTKNAVENLILEDRKISIFTIADNLNISYGTVHTIIKEQLQFRKICCRWIPHFLNLDQKLNRIQVSKALLKRYEEEGDHFLDQIVTGDESWCYHYDPSTKRASMEWKRGDSPRQKKIRSQRSAGKVLLTIFWDVDGPICLDFLSSRQCMNSDLYCDILVNNLKPGIRNKRRGKLSKGVLFLHDNARPHTSCKTVSTIIKLGFEVLEHPAYSPDLAPSDYFLFGLLKKELKGKRFDSDEDVQKVVQDFFHTLPKSAYKEGIYKLPERWRRCIESQDCKFKIKRNFLRDIYFYLKKKYLTVVALISEGHVLVTSQAARLYFISFHILCVVIVLNIFTAFVLEAFLLQYSVTKSQLEFAIERKIEEMGLRKGQ
ncbi:hypothetical protein LAZ67_3001722 [Cordylochernes scorpioides]|uniref:Ion transport domain-containing protein n=1 Tax=Cordylochernes scorpioides TaxID=51811 RepID=A0ABY6KA42_9ARAC|nr:hypothetical protein LAZ67_3001722 [Cordylochernes scorpioides]